MPSPEGSDPERTAAEPPPVTAPLVDPAEARRVRLAAALFGVTVLAFAPAVTLPFVLFDDPDYVTDNPPVQAGVTWHGVLWALRTRHAANWHPLTWLSHMLDVDLFGDWAGGHHLTSVLLHAATAVVLFAALEQLTKRPRRSALVAALFALHPLRVESVAWVAERKDVLSGLFFSLTLLAYARWAERATLARGAAVVASFALGLASKPMLVTLPAVLLLLDAWPLDRLRRLGAPRVVAEKLPLFAMSALASATTLGAQARARDAVTTLGFRVENALVAYATYVRRTLLPFDLGPFYALRFVIPAWKVALAAAVLALLSGAALALARRRPAVSVGWAWFLGMLVPVIGLVQVGAQAMADRYTYLPGIGLAIAAVWGAGDALAVVSGARDGLARPAARAATYALLATYVVLTWTQIRCWRSQEALFLRAEQVDGPSWMADAELGGWYGTHGEYPRARERLVRAVAQRRDDTHLRVLLAGVQLRQGDDAAAERTLLDAAAIDPTDPRPHADYAALLAREGRLDRAIDEARVAYRLDPRLPAARANLAILLRAAGRADEAAAILRAP